MQKFFPILRCYFLKNVQSLTLFLVWYLEMKMTYYIKILKSSQWTFHFIDILLLEISSDQKCSSSFSLFIDMYLIFFEHFWKKISQCKTSSNQNCPTEIEYCSLLCIQFHYNSRFMDEIFCGYSIDDACNFDASRSSKANFVR